MLNLLLGNTRGGVLYLFSKLLYSNLTMQSDRERWGVHPRDGCSPPFSACKTLMHNAC